MMKQAKPRAVQALSQPKAAALDLSSVATKAPPETPQSSPPTRIFGLQEAPCYYPTAEEFMEPLKFIESIRPEAEKAGICKIIPPNGWKPSFALNTETFRFKTRIQKLNSMEGETRTNLNYLDQLYKFHRQQGHPVLKIPQLDKRPIDLFRLRKEVATYGGYQKVTSGKKWAEIGRGLDYTRKQCTSLSSALKSAYHKVILPYEIYLSKQGKLAPESQSQEQKREFSTDPSADGTTSPQENSTVSSINMPETRKSKRIKKDPVSYADSEPSSPSSEDRMSSEPPSFKQRHKGEETSDICEICHVGCDLDKMLICDGCELGYHMYCLTPPLQQIPKTDWYCARCLVAGDDFGFEEGEEYSLSSFQQKCDTFKKNWFEKYGFKDGRAPEDTVEREFWRLVENAYETAEVEYGADLHSTQHGSGFASLERHPNDKYAAHPANLNNIPVLPESLFCHIKTDISGMMVPWLYVGMCFSTFCWHNEDHYTYSINYMHWGETKTWYGVPASDALKFEDTMRKAVPELFEQQPDLLFQLVTMLSPERLVANGVKVLALDQRPGQFVVTFPQAYHAGFNHGFNFAEAVNFAPPDWCQFGLECVQRYKDHRKQPVFSHDELIMTAALNDTSIATAYWLQDEVKNLLDRELADRKDVLKKQPTIRIVMEEVDRAEEEIQCLQCNSFIYLSQIGCKCTTKVACHDHISELCNCEEQDRFLRLRYSEEQLREITRRVIETAAIPDAWNEKYRKAMMETRVPSLKLLRSLLAEADRIPFPIKEAGRLRKFMNVANEWVESVTKSLVRKHHQGRRLGERAQGAPGKRLEDLQEQLRQVERLRFDCPEIKQLEESIETMHDFQMDARRALRRPERDLTECRELYESGVGMNIAMTEIDQLEAIVTDLAWTERVSAKGVLQEDYLLICTLIKEAERSGVSSSNPILVELLKKQETARIWEERAQEVMSRNPVDLDELQAVIEAGLEFPVSIGVLTKAEHLHSKAREWQTTMNQLLKKSTATRYEDRPLVSELKRALKVADSMPITSEHRYMLEEESRKYDSWFAGCQELLLPQSAKKFLGVELEEALESLKDNVEACTADEKTPGLPASSNSVKDHDTASQLKVETAAANQQDKVSPRPTMPALNPVAIYNSLVSGAPLVPVRVIPEPLKEAKGTRETKSDVDREEQIYCLCRTSESGMMVECDECHEWYHGPCVKVTKREATIKSNYICPVCNLGLVIKREKPRPMLEQLSRSSQEAQHLRFSTPEVPLLATIVDMAERFQRRVAKFLTQTITEEDILQVKAYLRKIEGLDIAMPEEREALRTHVFRLCPSSMPVPGVMLSTHPTAPPLKTIWSRCLCSRQASAPGATSHQPPQGDAEVMISCALCNDWHHLHCVGLNLDHVHKVARYICPVCSVVRKKQYGHGQVLYPAEVQARAVERIQASRDATKKKRKSSKDDIDPITGEERKKRPYKKREKLENGEKLVTKRSKSLSGQSTPSTVSMDSNMGTPQASGATTTLPSFSEGFLLPSDRHPTPQHHQQQHSHSSQHHQRTPSHSLPSYVASHATPPLPHVPHGSPHYHSTSPPQQHRYGPAPPTTNGSYRSYQPAPREHVQLTSMQGHPPPPAHSHPLSRGAAPPPSHPHPHSNSYQHSHPHPQSHSHLRSPPPPPHMHVQERQGGHMYSAQSFGSVQQGHYPPPPPAHQHPHPSQRGMDDRRSDMPPHPMRNDPLNHHPHYGHHQHPSPPSSSSSSSSALVAPSSRSYSSDYTNGNGYGHASGGPPVLPPMKNHHSVTQQNHGLKPSSRAVTVGAPTLKDGFSQQDTGSGGETETDEDDSSAAPPAAAL